MQCDILATWGHVLSCCNMRWWSWMNGTIMDLRISSQYRIQNAINKIHLCSLSLTYVCPYHNLNATMDHSIHNVDISKPLTHTMPYTLSAICPVQWKPGFIREENTSPKCQMPSNVSICPLKSGYDDELQSGRDPDEDNEHADELPWYGFWQFVQKFFGYAHFRVAFYCGQPKACLISILICHTCEVDGLSLQRRSAH